MAAVVDEAHLAVATEIVTMIDEVATVVDVMKVAVLLEVVTTTATIDEATVVAAMAADAKEETTTTVVVAAESTDTKAAADATTMAQDVIDEEAVTTNDERTAIEATVVADHLHETRLRESLTGVAATMLLLAKIDMLGDRHPLHFLPSRSHCDGRRLSQVSKLEGSSSVLYSQSRSRWYRLFSNPGKNNNIRRIR